MNRRILIQVTTPGVIIGLLLFAACLAGAWYIDRQQTNMAKILSRNVASLQAAQELEIRVRRLRFDSLINLMDPKKEARKSKIELDHAGFEKALESAHLAAHTPDEQALVEHIECGYRTYLQELDQMESPIERPGKPTDLGQWAEQHPIQNIVTPCQDLLTLSRASMKQTSQDTNELSRRVRFLMVLVGFVGPVSGLLIGYAVARGLSRSIYQLSVRVQDMARGLAPFSPAHLTGTQGVSPAFQDVAAVNIQADGDVQSLDRQLQQVVRRVEDVAERYQEQQHSMLRAEQLSAVGQLAASVAHEVRNPLTSVKMLVEAALRPRNPKPLSADDLKVIHGEVARLEHTVQSFLDFARLPIPRRSPCDLRDIVIQSLELVQARARQQKVEVITNNPDQPLYAQVDREQFCNVLVNLFLNALDAMPNGGRLEIHQTNTQGQGIRMEIADTGPGISLDMASRLFTPFSSSKPTGTGLGLSICRRIIEEHGGEITGHNRPEGGACFVISLPGEEAS